MFDLLSNIMYNYKQHRYNLRRLAMIMFGIKTVIVILSLLVFKVNTANADVYQVYLYYDNDQLFFDRSYDQKVKVFRGEKIGSSYPSGNFRAEVLDKDNKVVSSVSFDPRPVIFIDAPPPYRSQGGARVLDQGPTGFRLSYAPTGVKLTIYNPANQLILEYDISYLAELAPPSKQADAQPTRISWYWWALAIFVFAIIILLIWKFLRRKYKFNHLYKL